MKIPTHRLFIPKAPQLALLDSIVERALGFDVVFIDLFAGAGGVTSGIEEAEMNGRKTACVIACINHDPVAIASHHANWSESLHLTEDVRTADLTEIIWMVTELRKRKPDIVINLWASLECTNFSRAKGGLSRNADSRTLAEHLDRYVEAINPDSIWIENVREFLQWGPLEAKVKKTNNGFEYCPLEIKKEEGMSVLNPVWVPIKEKMGEDYDRWVASIDSFGYRHEHKLLNAADYGAHTSRIRLFIQFAKPFMPILWPEPTHVKTATGKSMSLFGQNLKKWNPVKEKLDFSDEGNCIFDRAKPYCDKTLERVYAGLKKFVANGDDTAFLSQYYSGNPNSKNISIQDPCGTITTIDHHALVSAKFIKPRHEITDQDRFIVSYHHSDTVQSIESPMATLTTKDKKAVTAVHFLNTMYGSGQQNRSIEAPLGTITTVNKVQLVNCVPSKTHFMNIQHGKSKNRSVEEPSNTTANPKLQLVSVQPWILDTNFSNTGSSVEEPMPTITASRKWHYCVNRPAPTLIARMDKTPPYLVTVDEGRIAIKITPKDTPIAIKIKLFMAYYGIVVIKMRMLKVKELKCIQGFSDNYVLLGSQAQQKKHIGNSVPPKMVKALIVAGFSWVFAGRKIAV